jgi:hypothetical protein
MMHALMSFLGCRGKLMKASDMNVLMSAAFGGITSIVNGKAWTWTNALRAYCLIIAVFLQSFYSNGDKIYQESLRLHGDSQRAPDREAMGWTASSSLHCWR